jgi:hypothetical protein
VAARRLGHAGADVVERPQQAAHEGEGQQREQQQRDERGPADAAWPRVGQRAGEAEADAVAVERGAREGPTFAADAVFGGVAAPARGSLGFDRLSPNGMVGNRGVVAR